MNVIYLDQNVVINLAEKSDQNARFARAQEAVLKQVETNGAIFPYSEVHFAESAAMSPESQRRVGDFSTALATATASLKVSTFEANSSRMCWRGGQPPSAAVQSPFATSSLLSKTSIDSTAREKIPDQRN